MTRDQIFQVVKNNVVDVLFDLDESKVVVDASLKELGANSVDRADIVTQSMEDLGLAIPAKELGGAKNLRELVDLFERRLQ